VLLPETTAQNALRLTERIRDTVASIRVPGIDRAITVSIGVADLIQHGGDAPVLLRQADRALYTAEAAGRNRVVIASADEPSSEEVIEVDRSGVAWCGGHKRSPGPRAPRRRLAALPPSRIRPV
jgi:predicted signal transduction protein with EAL and GGDEF domain